MPVFSFKWSKVHEAGDVVGAGWGRGMGGHGCGKFANGFISYQCNQGTPSMFSAEGNWFSVRWASYFGLNFFSRKTVLLMVKPGGKIILTSSQFAQCHNPKGNPHGEFEHMR